MAPASRLGRQIREILDALNRSHAASALIGGLALASYNVVRATSDMDLLIAVEDSDTVHEELTRLGYRCIHRSPDAANYLRGDERVDFLYASRPIARRLLEAAESRATPFGEVRVVGLEGLIAFKLQALVNDPHRTQDLEDIRALVKANSTSLKVPALREYFQLFERENLLDEILAEIS